MITHPLAQCIPGIPDPVASDPSSSDFESALSVQRSLAASTESEPVSHTLSDLTQSSIRCSKDLENLAGLASRQSRFEEEVSDSLNILTDRLNALESQVSDLGMEAQKRIDTMKVGMKSAFSALVERIIAFVRTSPEQHVKNRFVVRPNPSQSRIGMQRTRTTPVRE